jgi:hypothetical protein
VTVVDDGGGARAVIVDEVERTSCGVEKAGVGAADSLRKSPKYTFEWEKALHDHVAEYHVEQQLFVGPARTSRRLGPGVFTLCVREQSVEFLARSL